MRESDCNLRNWVIDETTFDMWFGTIGFVSAGEVLIVIAKL